MFEFGIKVVAWGKYTFFHCGCEFNLRGSSFPSILCVDHWRHLQALLCDDLDYPPARDIIAGIRSFNV